MITGDDQPRQVRLRGNLSKQTDNQRLMQLDQLKQEAKQNSFSQFPAGGYRASSSQQVSLLPKLNSSKLCCVSCINRDFDTPSSKTAMMSHVDREISQMELNARVRDLETTIIDFKANIERRITRTIEENPQKFMAVFKVFRCMHTQQLEEKETSLWKQNHDKHSSASDQLQMMKDGGRRQMEQLTTMILEVQKKVDDGDYKLSRLDKATESLAMKFNVVAGGGQQQQQMKAIGNGGGEMQSDFEVRILRDAFTQEKQHRDTTYMDLQRQYSDVNQRLMAQEAEFYGRLKTQRDELMDQHHITKQQIKGLDSLKLQQINKDQDYIKLLVGSIDAKIAEEVEKRMRNEFENKAFLEQKFQTFREEVRSDEKQLLLGEQKFMRQVHESLASLNTMLRDTREQLEAQLAASQTVVGENLKALSRTLDVVQSSTNTKVGLLEQAQRELNFRTSETRQMLHDHAQLISETLVKEFARQDAEREEFESRQGKLMQAHSDQINDLVRGNEEWRGGFEKKNLQVFTEVSNALKTLRGDLTRDRKDSQERHDLMSRDMVSQRDTFEGLMGNLERHLQQVEKQTDFKLADTKSELKEMMTNTKIQLQNETNVAVRDTLEAARVACTLLIKASESKLGETLRSEILLTKLYVDTQVDSSELRITEYVDEREKILSNNIQELIKKEQSERNKLLQLIEQYADLGDKLRLEMRTAIDLLKDQLSTQINTALQRLERDFKQTTDELHALIKVEVLNLELRQQKALQDLNDKLQKQLHVQQEYMVALEKSLRSYVDAQVEATKFELRTLIKQLENELFKLKVWVMKQIELMNQAMQELYTTLQSEMFMERMYVAATMEQYQESVEQALKSEHQQRELWQAQQETKMKDFSESILARVDSLDKLVIELRTTLEKQIGDMNAHLEKQIEELNSHLQAQVKELYRDLEMNIEQLRYEVGESLMELKEQVDQSHGHFEAKFFLESLLRQAEQDLEREAQASLISKVNKIVMEVARMELKLNLTKKDLDEFVQAAELNFQTLQEAIKSHITFLNELDAQAMTTELTNKAAFSDLHDSLREMYAATTKGINSLNEELDTALKEIQEALTQISDAQEQDLKNQDDKLIALENKLADQVSTVTGKIQLAQAILGTLEATLSATQQQSSQQNTLLVAQTSKLMMQNLQTLEGNIQRVMEHELGKIYEWQETFSTQVGSTLTSSATTMLQVKDVQSQLIDDYNTLTKELEENFEKVGQANTELEDKLIKSQALEAQKVKSRIDELEYVNEDRGKAEVLTQQKNQSENKKMDVVQAELAAMQVQIQELEGRTQDGLQNQVGEVQSQVEMHSLTLADLNKQLSGELDKIYAQLSILQNKSSSSPVLPVVAPVAQHDTEKLKELEDNLQEMGQGIEKELDATNLKVDQMLQEITQLQKDLKAQHKSPAVGVAVGGASDNSHLQKQIDDFQKEFEENLNQVATGIEKELDATNAKLEQLTKDMKNQHQNKSPTVVGGVPASGDVQTQLKSLKQENEENLNQVAEGIEKELDATNVKVDKNTQELQKLQKEILALQKGGGGGGGPPASVDNAQLKRQMDDFHKESEENLNQVAEGIEKELDATNAKVDKLTKDLTKLQQEFNTHKPSAPTTTGATSSNSGETDILKRQITDLQKELDEHTNFLNEIDQRIEKLGG